MVESGTPEVLMVTGYSGIGKTTLVRELGKPVLGERGYFISGKFDQHRRAIPYSKAPDLFRELSQQILAESEERVAEWKRRIHEAIGVYGQLIVDVIPEIELIIGKQASVPELPLRKARIGLPWSFDDLPVFSPRKSIRLSSFSMTSSG